MWPWWREGNRTETEEGEGGIHQYLVKGGLRTGRALVVEVREPGADFGGANVTLAEEGQHGKVAREVPHKGHEPFLLDVEMGTVKRGVVGISIAFFGRGGERENWRGGGGG